MLDLLRNEVEKAVEHGLYLHALSTAVTVPDVGAALRSPNGATTHKKYRNWFDDYAAEQFDSGNEYTTLTSWACYKFRCSLLHQHRQTSSDTKAPYERVVFGAKSDGNAVLDNCYIEPGGPGGKGVLALSVPHTVQRMFAAFDKFIAAEGETDVVRRNASQLVTIDPDLQLGYRIFAGPFAPTLIG